MEKFTRYRKAYDLYTEGFSYKDIQRLLKSDIPEVYDFYVNRMKHQGTRRTGAAGRFSFIRDLIFEFLMQLTPARRIVYTGAVLVFIISVLGNHWNYALLSFLVVNLLLALELADKLTAKSELEVAKEIQMSLMPKEAPASERYQISCFSETAREVGGDYYDFIPGSSTLIIVGDISGKGMGAAIHMVQVQSILHHIVQNAASPKEILVNLNGNLRKIFKKGNFFTVSIASLDTDGTLNFCRAGHLPLLHYCSSDEKFYNIIPNGMGLGLTYNHIFENTLEQIKIKPASGDILLFYTDGITEARNEYLQEYGEERLKQVIKRNSKCGAAELKQALLSDVSRFRNKWPAHDDLTFVIMKVV